MQPLVLHLPDEVRDTLEDALSKIMPEIPERMGRKDYKALGDVVSKILFRYEKDTEVGRFLSKFQEAYLGMKLGTSNPVILLENLPPTYGRLVMYGLGDLEGEITFGEKKDHENQDANAAAAHRDSSYRNTNKGKKLGQFLYCEEAGTNPQSTVFITADEVIDYMALQRPRTDFESARADIIHRLQQIMVTTDDGKSQPFLSKNPAYDSKHPQEVPEFIVFTLDRSLNDWRKIDPKDLSDYKAFSEAADQVIQQQASEATASTKSNSLALWNDLLMLHARGKTHDGRDEDELSGRRVEIMESRWTHAPDPSHIAVAAPCSQINLKIHPAIREGLIKHGHLREI